MYSPSNLLLKIIVIQSCSGKFLHIMSHNVDGRPFWIHNHVAALTAGTWRMCYFIIVRSREDDGNILM